MAGAGDPVVSAMQRSFVAAEKLAKDTGDKDYIYATKFLPARATAYDPTKNIMNSRLPGEGSEASYLRAFRIRFAQQDIPSLTEWATKQPPPGVPGGPGVPEAMIVRHPRDPASGVNFMLPVVPSSKTDFWCHQYDLCFRIRGKASAYHKTLIRLNTSTKKSY